MNLGRVPAHIAGELIPHPHLSGREVGDLLGTEADASPNDSLVRNLGEAVHVVEVFAQLGVDFEEFSRALDGAANSLHDTDDLRSKGAPLPRGRASTNGAVR